MTYHHEIMDLEMLTVNRISLQRRLLIRWVFSTFCFQISVITVFFCFWVIAGVYPIFHPSASKTDYTVITCRLWKSAVGKLATVFPPLLQGLLFLKNAACEVRRDVLRLWKVLYKSKSFFLSTLTLPATISLAFSVTSINTSTIIGLPNW